MFFSWPLTAREPHIVVLLVLLLCGLHPKSVTGQACSSSDLTDNDFLYGYVNPTRINAQLTGVIMEFPMINTVGVESTNVGSMPRKYIEAEYVADTNSLRIYATAALADYESEQFAAEITLNIELICTSNTRRRLVFQQLFDDSNNHDPVFGQSVYTIELALPLPRGFELTFFQEISARDLDIRHNQVTFSASIDSSVVTVGTTNRVGDDQKTYFASLKTSLQLLTLLQPLEFEIIATDSGTPSRSGRATIILKADPDEAFVPVPVFDSPIYRGSLDAERALSLANPVIKPETFNSEIAFGFSGGDSSLFTQSNEENVITINLARALTEADVQNRAVLMTTLVANRANVEQGNTVILVDIPTTTTPAPFAAPAFEKELYVGSLDTNRELTLEQLVITTETFDASITLSLEGDNADLFDVSNIANLVTVRLLNELTALDLVGKSILTANVRANRANVGSGVASIAISIASTTPSPLPTVPRFERTFYEASISRNNELEVQSLPTVVLDTYTDGVSFELEGEEAQWFHLANTQNEVTLELEHSLVAADLSRSFVIVRLWARHPTDGSGSTELIVSLPSLLTANFNLGVTVGQIDAQRNLDIPAITVDSDAYTTDMTFELIGADASLFAISNLANILTISLAAPLSDDNILNRIYYRTEVVASNALNSRVGISVLIVDIVHATPLPSPKFTQPAYRGSLDLDLELTFESVLLDEATYGTDVVFSLDGGDQEIFTTTNTLNRVDVALRQTLAETDIGDRTYFMTVLRAERPTYEPAATVLLVNIPVTTPRPPIISPAFTKPLYRGSVHEETGFEVEAVQLLLSTYSSAITFELTGDDSKFFDVTNDLNVVTIVLGDGVTESQLEIYEFLAFELVARHPEANLARAGVLISVPVTECEIDQTPTFENKLNSIHIKQTMTYDVLGRFTASVASHQSAVLQYRLDDDDYLSSRLSVDSQTGQLTLISVLDPATYTIAMFAIDTETLLEGRTDIQITVELLETCPLTEGGVHVEDTLLIKYLVENQAHVNVLSSLVGECVYDVINIIPSSLEFVRINTESNHLDTIAFDREDDIFADMEVPQIQVTLELRCPNQAIPDPFTPFTPNSPVSSFIERWISPQAPDSRWYTLTSPIAYSNKTTLLSIIIEDENDNIPQFLFPFVEYQLFGYPDAQLAAAIMPPFLLRVVARDRDAGLNAQVSYSLVDSADFQVHSETGVVTPLRDALHSAAEVAVTIRATDRNGAADGLVNTVHVRVKRLEAKHIAVLTIETEEFDDVDDVIQTIDESVSLELRVLHSAVISLEDDDSLTRADGRLSVLRIYAYAFDNTGDLIEAIDIQENLKDFNAQLFRLTSATYEQYTDTNNTNSPSDTLGLIIACAVLFALLLVAVLATFTLWWFKVRPYEYRQMDDTSSVSSKQGFANEATGPNNANGGAPQSSPIMKIDRFEVQKRDSMALRGTTTHETSDTIDPPHLLARRLTARLDVEASRAEPSSLPVSQTATLEANPTRKMTGVRFNELVERIDIEVEPEIERITDDDATTTDVVIRDDEVTDEDETVLEKL